MQSNQIFDNRHWFTKMSASAPRNGYNCDAVAPIVFNWIKLWHTSLLVFFLSLVPTFSFEARSADSRCPTPHDQSPELSAMIRNGLIVLNMMEGTPNPNVLSPSANAPQTTLADFREEILLSFNRTPYLVYAFYRDDIDTRDRTALFLTTDEIWCLLRPLDTLLVADDQVAHFTTVEEVLPTQNLLRLADPWPFDSFLLAGRNSVGVSARLIEREGQTISGQRNAAIEITKEEFDRVMIGAVTIDEPSLIDFIMAEFPRTRGSGEFASGAIYTLLDVNNNRFLTEALFVGDYFRSTASMSTLPEQSPRFAEAYAFALLLSLYENNSEFGEKHTRESGVARLKELEQAFGQDKLFAARSPLDYLRLSFGAGRAGRVDVSEEWLNKAIDVDDKYYPAYVWRGDIRRSRGDFSGAMDDEDVALALISEEATKLAELRARAVREAEKRPLDRRLADLDEERAHALRVLCAAAPVRC